MLMGSTTTSEREKFRNLFSPLISKSQTIGSEGSSYSCFSSHMAIIVTELKALCVSNHFPLLSECAVLAFDLSNN